MFLHLCFLFFFFNDTATTEIYTLSLHDALPIWGPERPLPLPGFLASQSHHEKDRKSTRLNSSHQLISYAVFCLKKKKNKLYYCGKTRRKRKKMYANDVSVSC